MGTMSLISQYYSSHFFRLLQRSSFSECRTYSKIKTCLMFHYSPCGAYVLAHTCLMFQYSPYGPTMPMAELNINLEPTTRWRAFRLILHYSGSLYVPISLCIPVLGRALLFSSFQRSHLTHSDEGTPLGHPNRPDTSEGASQRDL